MATQPETTAASFVYHRRPPKVSRKDFHRYIAPHLHRPKKGPKPKRSLYKIFTYLLYVFPTGIQGEQLKTTRQALHYTPGYTGHKRWSKAGAYHARFEASVMPLYPTDQLDPSVRHGDGANTVGKKGATALATPVINPRKAPKSSPA